MSLYISYDALDLTIQEHPPPGHGTFSLTRTVSKWMVCILLECFLVREYHFIQDSIPVGCILPTFSGHH